MTTPRLATLAKYGLTPDDFRRILDSQGGVCAICGRVPNGRWNIDHYHVKGWSRMPAERRKLYVRGIVCWFCNRYYLSKSISVERAENIVLYLTKFQEKMRLEKGNRNDRKESC